MAAEADNDVIRAVTLENLRTGDRATLTARYVIDVTETGELLGPGGVEHVIGAEARGEFDEPHAPEQAQPLNQQGIIACFSFPTTRARTTPSTAPPTTTSGAPAAPTPGPARSSLSRRPTPVPWRASPRSR